MGIFNFFGLGNNDSEKVAEYIQNGAVIIDVRTPAEFNDGHADGSVNIPLSEFGTRPAWSSSGNSCIWILCQSINLESLDVTIKPDLFLQFVHCFGTIRFVSIWSTIICVWQTGHKKCASVIWGMICEARISIP